MSKSRREFLDTSVRAGAAMSAFAHPAFSAALELPLGPAVPSEKPLHPLNILILGGTSFIGPHLIAYAMNRGHSITTFTRGRTEPTVHKALFKSVEQFVGDRENDLEALRGRTWDAVIRQLGQASRVDRGVRGTAPGQRGSLRLHIVDGRVLPLPRFGHFGAHPAGPRRT